MYPAVLRVAALCACLLTGIAGAQAPETAATLAQTGTAHLTIDRDDDGLRIAGSGNSSAHETILREVLRQASGPEIASNASIALSTGVALPPGWTLVSERALRAVLSTKRARASITPERVTLIGLTSRAEKTRAMVQRLATALPTGMQLQHDVTALGSDQSYVDLCRQQFERLTDGLSIEFGNSDAEVRPDAYRKLDGIVELASQCPSLRFEVVGHTDHSGDDDANRIISEGRAEAVRRYLSARGLPDERLRTRGAGSSEPRMARSDGRARRMNRRVELRLADP